LNFACGGYYTGKIGQKSDKKHERIIFYGLLAILGAQIRFGRRAYAVLSSPHHDASLSIA
jgi:hypothetical protein